MRRGGAFIPGKNVRLHKLYRELEASGRRDGKGERTGQGLSPRTVRYIHTIVGAALNAAVEAEPPLLLRYPAAKASPPSARKPGRPRCTRGPQRSSLRSWAGPVRTAACTPPGRCWRGAQ